MKLTSGHLLGKCLRSCRVADFMLAEGVYSSGFRTPRHSHENAILCLILRGVYTEAQGQQSRMRKPLSAFFLPPEKAHSSQFHSKDVQIFRVEINPIRLKDMREFSIVVDRSHNFDGGLLPDLATKLYAEFREMDTAAPLAMEGLILEMLAIISRRSIKITGSTPPRSLEQAKDLLHAHFADGLKLTDIAGIVGLHPVYFAQAFRKYYGCTAGDYIRSVRIAYGCRQLITSDTPINRIALAAGFSDQSHFTRALKRQTGMTPGQYREILSSH